MTEETIGEWIDCVVDNDYQIWSKYPYPIKKKESERIVKEWMDKDGYVMLNMNKNKYRKHRIIGLQFIPNDDNLPCIDHINRNRTDNRIENLRWVSISDNSKNCSSSHGIIFEFFDEIPCENEDDIIEVRDYGIHEFENLYYYNDYFYLFNGIQYRRLHICYFKNGSAFVSVSNIEGKPCKICYTKFKRLYNII